MFLLTSGIYDLAGPIRIGRAESPYQVLLGLGMATLVPAHAQGGAAIEVADVPGVRVTGVLLQASKSHEL